MIAMYKSVPDLLVTIEDMIAEVQSDVETCRFSVPFLGLGKRTKGEKGRAARPKCYLVSLNDDHAVTNGSVPIPFPH